MTVHVIVVDDHPVVRRGLGQMISSEPDIEIMGECGSASQLMSLLNEGIPDVLILDVALPDANGIDLLSRFKEQAPRMKTIILSVYPAEQLAARAIRAGAHAYLTKESATEELVAAIRTVLSGRRYLTADAADALASAIQTPDNEQPETVLSERERQVVEFYASGRTMTEISDAMSLSIRTVSTYKTRVLEKLHLSTNAELIAWAIRHKLVKNK